MAYGSNQPWGLQAIKTTTGAPWNGQTSSYLIQSGYANNIFKGDLVFLGADGYIHNLSEITLNLVNNVPTLQQSQAIGVFNGCSFSTTTATNPIDPSSPGRSYWPAGTVTLNGVPATCDIIDDPSVIFNIQSNITGGAGIPSNAQGATAGVVYDYSKTVSPNPTGNFQTGISNMTLDVASIALLGANAAANPLGNLRILRFVPTPPNAPGIPYNNVEVLIQNHSFQLRAPGI